MEAKDGGAVGTPAEAAVTHAWPMYEAEYLKSRLKEEGATGKYDGSGLKGVERGVYLDKITENYKYEADECLK